MSNLTDFKLLTKADVATIFGVCTKTIETYIRDGRLPAPVPFASREYWHPETFKEFLNGTFGRGEAKPGPTAEPETSPEPSLKPSARSHPREAKSEKSRDSSPVVRQKDRQEALLRKLNASH